MKNIEIDTEYVTLGQLLKMTDIISSGGMARWFLAENDVLVNDELEHRRGRKLRNGDTVTIPENDKFCIVENLSEE